MKIINFIILFSIITLYAVTFSQKKELILAIDNLDADRFESLIRNISLTQEQKKELVNEIDFRISICKEKLYSKKRSYFLDENIWKILIALYYFYHAKILYEEGNNNSDTQYGLSSHALGILGITIGTKGVIDILQSKFLEKDLANARRIKSLILDK